MVYCHVTTRNRHLIRQDSKEANLQITFSHKQINCIVVGTLIFSFSLTGWIIEKLHCNGVTTATLKVTQPIAS